MSRDKEFSLILFRHLEKVVNMKINETWKTCLFCGKREQVIPPVKGLIHMTICCKECKERITNEHIQKPTIHTNSSND